MIKTNVFFDFTDFQVQRPHCASASPHPTGETGGTGGTGGTGEVAGVGAVGDFDSGHHVDHVRQCLPGLV
jgi:hypothetical protein